MEGESSTAVVYRYGSGRGIQRTVLPADAGLHWHLVAAQWCSVHRSGATRGAQFAVFDKGRMHSFKKQHSNCLLTNRNKKKVQTSGISGLLTSQLSQIL